MHCLGRGKFCLWQRQNCTTGAGTGLGLGALLWLLLCDPRGVPLMKLLGNLKLVSRWVERREEGVDFNPSLGIAVLTCGWSY